MKCIRCSDEIPQERIDALPHTLLCVSCASKLVKPVKGAMYFACKTSPELCVMESDYFDSDWKKYNPKFGRGSGVHAVMRARKTR